jgi:hypothetical protein
MVLFIDPAIISRLEEFRTDVLSGEFRELGMFPPPAASRFVKRSSVHCRLSHWPYTDRTPQTVQAFTKIMDPLRNLGDL